MATRYTFDQSAADRRKAAERAARGFVSFTRPLRREQVMGVTRGENRAQTTARKAQARRRYPR